MTLVSRDGRPVRNWCLRCFYRNRRSFLNFRDGKVAHEHIYWDQASVLVQIGLLDPASLPIAGVETARKVLDNSLPSNELLGAVWTSSENKPI